MNVPTCPFKVDIKYQHSLCGPSGLIDEAMTEMQPLLHDKERLQWISELYTAHVTLGVDI